MGQTIYAPGFTDRPARPAASAAQQGRIRARYENATTTPDNARSWSWVDYYSAKSANDYATRRTLRTRSRHELVNNPFLFGVCNSNADDLIDTGPTLQVLTPDAAYNRAVERSWSEWWTEVGGVEKLRTQKLAKTVDGEGFLVLRTVEDLEHAVKLYPCETEADQVTSPAPGMLGDFYLDGVAHHRVTGRPISYTVLKTHPGDFFFPGFNPLAADVIPARHVIHWFPKFRPGVIRGIPVFTSSLDLFAELRAFRKAVLKNAQIAASFTAMMTQNPTTGAVDDEDEDAEYQAFKRVPIDPGMLTSLPPGAAVTGFDARQPQTTYEMFQSRCLAEACRPLCYPLNLALGTSKDSNFSSAKLDHNNYRSSLRIERDGCNVAVLGRIFREWHAEAVLCGAVPFPPSGGLTPPDHEWHWPGFEPLDPVVDATAEHDRLAHGTLTYREFWARRGYDWRDVMAQQAAEREELERLDLTFGDPVTRSVSETTDEEEPDTAAARRGMKVRATKDDNGQEHGDDGRFGTGGSGGSSDDDETDEHDDTHAGWDEEDTAAQERWDAEDESREEVREAEDAHHEEAYDKTTDAIDKARDKEDAAAEKASDAREKSREKQDKETERTRAQENRAREKVRAARVKADKTIGQDRAKAAGETAAARKAEDKERWAAQEQEKADLEARHKEENDSAPDDEDEADIDARSERHEEELSELDETHTAAEDAIQEARDQEDADLEAAQEKEDAAEDARREEEDEAWEATETARDEADEAQQAARDQEDAEADAADAARQAARDKEDESRWDAYEAAGNDRKAARTKQDAETQQARDAEDAGRYRAREKANPKAHEAYRDDEYHKAGAKAARRHRVKGRRRGYARAR